SNYWFETGTPSFLIKMLYSRKYAIPSLESLQASDKLLGSFDVEHIEVETLLFQTGYLTIKSVQQIAGGKRFSLGYPNLEVRQSLADSLLTYFTGTLAESEKAKFAAYDALLANDPAGLRDIFHAFFASIPSDWYRKNQLSRYEGYYASVVYCYFAALGLDVHPEEPTNKGRLDLSICFQDRVYILEFKVVELAGEGKPLEQIKAMGYAEKYAGQEVYLIGVEFSSQDRNVVGFEWEKHRA
ncbi:MAG: PD-(D/E)XK nuclease domain-containing protein, partial [Desulfonatronovibrio sp.]